MATADSQVGRKIIDRQPDKIGLFPVPDDFTRDDEVVWAKVRMDSSRLAQYQDSHCGFFPNTFDPTGAYLCHGCNKLAPQDECLIRKIKTISDPAHSSCGYWEITNAGDMEARYSPHGRLDDKRIGFGTTPNDKGFGCERCEYGQKHMPKSDSEGRPRWCQLKGMPVEDKACCEDNEPEKTEKTGARAGAFKLGYHIRRSNFHR